MKDVTNSALTEIKVEFKPATISIDHKAVEQQLNAVVAQYKDYEVTASTYRADYDERTRLNKLKEALEIKRKEIKDNINNPYKEFEKWYKDTIKPLDDVINHITDGLNTIDEHEHRMRVDVVRASFESKCDEACIKLTTFEDLYESYSLKKYFKAGKFELKKSTLEEFDKLVLGRVDELEEIARNKRAIVEQAQEYNLPQDSYIRHLEDGKSLVDVLSIMKSDKAAQELRKEQEEARAKAEAKRKAEIERIAQEQAKASIKAFDTDTGEIIDNSPVEALENQGGVNRPESLQNESEVPKFKPAEPLVVTLRLEIFGGKKQLDELKEHLEDNFINFVELRNF